MIVEPLGRSAVSSIAAVPELVEVSTAPPVVTLSIETMSSSAGNTSSISAPVTSDGPRLATVMVFVTDVSPGVTVVTPSYLIIVSVVALAIVSVSTEVAVSRSDVTVAVLTTSFIASDLTFATTV